MTTPTRSLFRSLAFPLLLCGLAIGAVLVFTLMNRNDVRQPRPDIRTVPPELITYRQTSVFVCPVEGEATCFALYNDTTFVIGSAEPPMLSFFDETGTLLRTIPLPEEPQAVVCGTAETFLKDKIVVAHPKHIAIYSAKGQHEDSWELPDEKSNVRCMVITRDYLYAADTGKLCIHRFDVKEKLDLTFGDGFVVFAAPITMTFSPKDDLLYIANPGNHRVEVFTQDGKYKPELCWGEGSAAIDGFAGCCNPIGLAALDDGRILTVEKSVSRIKIYEDGKLDCVVADHTTLESLRRPAKRGGYYFSAVPLSDGRIAVFDFDGKVLRIFSPNGR
jgi:hypothetical protein